MAAFVGSEQDDMAVNDAVFKGQYQLVFISPESLIRNLRWREMLRSDVYQQNLVGLAIDEAHCVTKWYVILLFVLYFLSLSLVASFPLILSHSFYLIFLHAYEIKSGSKANGMATLFGLPIYSWIFILQGRLLQTRILNVGGGSESHPPQSTNNGTYCHSQSENS